MWKTVSTIQQMARYSEAHVLLNVLRIIVLGVILVLVPFRSRSGSLVPLLDLLHRNLTTINNRDGLNGRILGGCWGTLDPADDALAPDDSAKDDVLAVQVWCRYRGEEELGAVGVRAGVGHAVCIEQEELGAAWGH